MEKKEIIAGQEYGISEPLRVGGELQHVRVLENVRGTRWKVEWIEPNPGLTDYVASKNIVVKWSERRALLRDEERGAELQRVSAMTFPGSESPLASAIDDVLTATGEPTLHVWRGIFEFDSAGLERVCARAGIAMPEHRAGYVDRFGQSRLPFESAIAVARAFAAAEPTTVLDYIDIEERRVADEARQPGNHYLNKLLIEYRANWALIRQWAGFDAALASREARIAELERLLSQTIWDLRRPSLDAERIAGRLERAIR